MLAVLCDTDNEKEIRAFKDAHCSLDSQNAAVFNYSFLTLQYFIVANYLLFLTFCSCRFSFQDDL